MPDGPRVNLEITKGKNGILKATIGYFQRPGEERTWAGVSGVLTSARNLVGFSQFRSIRVFMVHSRQFEFRCC